MSLPYLAAAFDLDDTLLRDDLTISDYTLSVLRALSAAGVAVIPASGRAQMSMMPFIRRLSPVPLYIACNGGEIWSGSGELLHAAPPFSAETGKAVAAFGKRHHVYAQTYDGSYFYYNEESDWSRKYAAASMLRGQYVGDLEAYIQEPRNKILMMAEPEKIEAMRREAEVLFAGRVSVTCSKPWFLEFNPAEATKGCALQKAADLLHIPLEKVIAFGDGLNDLSMMRAAGRGVLMENGRPVLRDQVDDICLSNQEDGVARYLVGVFREVLA